MLIIKMDLWKSGRWFVDFLQNSKIIWRSGDQGQWRKFIQCDCPLSERANGTGRLLATVQALFLEEVFLSGKRDYKSQGSSLRR